MKIIFLLAAVIAAMVLWTRSLSRKAVRTVPPAGRFAPVKGGTIHFVEAGPKQAQTLVMIHGLTGNLQHFTYALTDLLAQDFHVIALDRPGNGYSTRDHDDMAALDIQARMIWEFLDTRGVTRPVLVGHSLGGAVALQMALLRPNGPSALALLAPATQPQEAVPEVFRPLQLRRPWTRRALAHTLAVPATKFTRSRVLNMVFAPEPVPPAFNTRGGGALALRPETFIAASSDLMAVSGTMEDLHDLYTRGLPPGAILFGTDDAILSPDHQGMPMAQYGLPTELLPGRGHMLPLTAPAECADFIRRTTAKAGL